MKIRKNQIWQSKLYSDIKLFIISVSESKNTVKALVQSDLSDNGKVIDYRLDTFNTYYMPDQDEIVFTRVIFKYENDGSKDVVAFLIDVPANWYNVVCYAHVGQHSEASIDYAKDCKLAKPEDYRDLWKELVDRGYFMKIINKFPPHFVQGGV